MYLEVAVVVGGGGGLVCSPILFSRARFLLNVSTCIHIYIYKSIFCRVLSTIKGCNLKR